MFDRVVIKISPRSKEGNLHILVHPFNTDHIVMMMGKESIRWRKEELHEWQVPLAEQLFDKIPGLQTLFFNNGEITMQHAGVFSDTEVFLKVKEIVEPVLVTNHILAQAQL